MLSTPVVLIIFKRPDLTERVLQAIAAVKPRTLLVVADGPRPGRAGEAEACAAGSVVQVFVERASGRPVALSETLQLILAGLSLNR